MECESEHVPMAVRVGEVEPGRIAVERVVDRRAPVRLHAEDLPQRARRVLRETGVRVLADDRVQFLVRSELDHASVVVRRPTEGRHPEDDRVECSGIAVRPELHDAVVRRPVRAIGIRLVRVHERRRRESRIQREPEEAPLARSVRVRERVERRR